MLIVEDSAFARKAFTRLFRTAPDMEVAGVAVDGRDGIEKTLSLKPDVITLDIQMPRLGGLDALRQIMERCPTPVLLLSSHTRAGADVTLRGLELGALDFVDKSRVRGQMNLLQLRDELLKKVRALVGAGIARRREAPLAPRPLVVARRRARADVIVLATSTGGPAALQSIVPRLPTGLPLAVLIVQHIPAGFTRSLAERLAARSQLPVEEAEHGEVVTPGRVLIAPGGLNMSLARDRKVVRVELGQAPRGSLHRPSADVLMCAVADIYGPRVVGVVLTGMGDDGVAGLRAIRDAGGRTFAESEESCVIFGMPKAAINAGVAQHVVPLHRLPDEILAAV